ncbi:MAG: CPBP family intramembrane glutamic endopeptidase [Cyclobacteriaceae bacterium]
MKKILAYILDYQRKHFDIKLYLSIALFLVLIFFFNYYYDFENSVLDRYNGQFRDGVHMFLFHGIPYLIVCLLLYFFNKQRDWLSSGRFWLMFFIGFTILALDRSFYGYVIFKEHFDVRDYVFVSKTVRWLSSTFVVVIPLLIIYMIVERDDPKIYYGLSPKRFDFKPYLILLLLAGVCVGIGSFFADLQAYYPRYQFSRGSYFAEQRNLPEAVTVLIYELAYGSDFIGVEIFFRGFLIFAFSRTLGGYAILPMAVTYAVLHFGKPMTEAISSIFGGYLLGIISYNTRSVWGGIIIHMGIAWLMEVFGYLHRLL